MPTINSIVTLGGFKYRVRAVYLGPEGATAVLTTPHGKIAYLASINLDGTFRGLPITKGAKYVPYPAQVAKNI